MAGRWIVAGIIVVTNLYALREFWSEWRWRRATDPHRAPDWWPFSLLGVDGDDARAVLPGAGEQEEVGGRVARAVRLQGGGGHAPMAPPPPEGGVRRCSEVPESAPTPTRARGSRS
jgi:hypothetical protein